MKNTTILPALREALSRGGVQGLLLPVNDPYMSEYPPAHYRRLAWLTGFTGSAGSVAVLPARAALFTDGRYTLQAAQQVDGALYETHNSAECSVAAWLKEHADAGAVIGYDPWLHTVAAIRRLEQQCAGHVVLKPLEENPVDALWEDRPALEVTAMEVHPKTYSGEVAGTKRERIAALVQEGHAAAALITAPDSVCWLLDVRGGDVPHTPLVLAMALLHADGGCDLFMAERPLTDAMQAHLGATVRVHSTDALGEVLGALQGKRVLCDPAQVPMACDAAMRRAGIDIIEGADPCLLPKACKNTAELDGIRAAHLRDGVALTHFLCWLDGQVERGAAVTELEAEHKLEDFRARDALFHGPSFDTIAGAGPHGAIVHYRATEQSNRTLKNGELFLLDSGGQYPDGTTDVTRTVAIGPPTQEMRTRFTLVLKGHIALAMAVFPQDVSGSQLDVLARSPLWQAGLDYAHGTGHGVGQYLCVHEGPQRISKRGGDVALREGMILSNEPGYYKTDAYGIRIENLVAVCKADDTTQEGAFLRFETLTCAPIDTRLVVIEMLSKAEQHWLNAYHSWVEVTLTPLLDAQAQAWLKRACAAL